MNTKDYIESGILTQCLFGEASEEDTKRFFKELKKSPEIRNAWEDIQHKNMEILLGMAEKDPPLPPRLREKIMASIGHNDLVIKGYNPFTDEYNPDICEKEQLIKLQADQIIVNKKWRVIVILGIIGMVLFIFIAHHFYKENQQAKDKAEKFKVLKKAINQ